jgi:hypothetical protein
MGLKGREPIHLGKKWIGPLGSYWLGSIFEEEAAGWEVPAAGVASLRLHDLQGGTGCSKPATLRILVCSVR